MAFRVQEKTERKKRKRNENTTPGATKRMLRVT